MVDAGMASTERAYTNDRYPNWTSVTQSVIFSDSTKSSQAYHFVDGDDVMGRFLGLVAFVVIAAAGLYIYMHQAQSATIEGAGSPQGTVDVVAVRRDLMSIAQAERTHNSLNSSYGSLEELRSSGDLTMGSDRRGPYTYSVEVTHSGFLATATYSGPASAAAAKTIRIDQDMHFSQD